MHTTDCEEEGEKSGNIPNCRRNLFFPSWESRAHRKVFERFYYFCTLHIVARCAGQPSPQAKPSHAHNEQTTDPCGIPEVRPRLQTSGPALQMCQLPPPSYYLPPQCLIHKGYQESQQKYEETAGCNWTVFLDGTQFLTISLMDQVIGMLDQVLTTHFGKMIDTFL